MARIAGVNIPDNKHIVISLGYVYGIGPSTGLNCSTDYTFRAISTPGPQSGTLPFFTDAGVDNDGDGVCEGEETCETCSYDCGECVCGDDICEFGEIHQAYNQLTCYLLFF